MTDYSDTLSQNQQNATPDAWADSNGSWLEAIGGTREAVRAARRAGWTLDKLAEQIRDHWHLADTPDARDGAR